MPVLIDAKVSLIEQPFSLDKDAWLDDLMSPIPVVADESVRTLADIPSLVDRFDMVNIKLDREVKVDYSKGYIFCPKALWG